jgi:DNA helicase-4
VQLLNAGVKVSGDRHEYLIPFNQLLSVHCKRGLVWGELEFVLPDDKVVRLHGTEWSETQRFYHHLHTLWQQWSTEMSDIAAGAEAAAGDDRAHPRRRQVADASAGGGCSG